MSQLENEMINFIEQNLPYIRLAIDSKKSHEEHEIANWLWQFLHSNYNAIDANIRAEAIAARDAVNGKPFEKASH